MISIRRFFRGDACDGDLTDSIDVAGLPVDTSTSGKHTITYTVADSEGNTATASRTVNVDGDACNKTQGCAASPGAAAKSTCWSNLFVILLVQILLVLSQMPRTPR